MISATKPKRTRTICVSLIIAAVVLSASLCVYVYFIGTRYPYSKIVLNDNKTVDINQIIGHSAKDIIDLYGDFYPGYSDDAIDYADTWAKYSLKGRRDRLERYLTIYFDSDGIAARAVVSEHSGAGG